MFTNTKQNTFTRLLNIVELWALTARGRADVFVGFEVSPENIQLQ